MNIQIDNYKYKFKQLTFDEMNVVYKSVQYLEKALRVICEDQADEEQYLSWSISIILTNEFFKKVNLLTPPKKFSFTLHLHEVFVLHTALLVFQSNANVYDLALSRDLIMHINPQLPRTKSTQTINLYSSI